MYTFQYDAILLMDNGTVILNGSVRVYASSDRDAFVALLEILHETFIDDMGAKEAYVTVIPPLQPVGIKN